MGSLKWRAKRITSGSGSVGLYSEMPVTRSRIATPSHSPLKTETTIRLITSTVLSITEVPGGTRNAPIPILTAATRVRTGTFSHLKMNWSPIKKAEMKVRKPH